MNVLLLLSEGMSLKKWDELGQLSRELDIYQQLGENLGIIFIHSYGKREARYLIKYPNIRVLDKPWFIPDSNIIPVRLKRMIINKIYRILEFWFRKDIFLSIQIVKTNQFSDLPFALKIKRRFSSKMVIRMGYYHTIDKKRFNSNEAYNQQVAREMYYFNQCDAIIVTNPDGRDYIVQTYQLTRDKVNYIPNYIDTNIFRPLNTSKQYDLLFVGRLTPEKNLPVLLKKLSDTTLKILLIGSGPEKELIQAIAASKGLNLKIIERIDNNDLSGYYNMSKIFILPSKYESNPKVLLEAMACGCICIGTNVKGIDNIIIHGQNGFLVDKDLNSLNEVLQAITKSDFTSVKETSISHILEHNSIIKNLDREVQIYNRLIN